MHSDICYKMNLEETIYNLALGIPGLLLAIVCHEVAHGYMAKHFGDPTAKLAGRLTFNPVAHLDLLGSVIVPILGAFLGGVSFGWAKPVPVDSRYFKNIRTATFWVSFAGPLTNFILVIISAMLCAVVAVKFPPTFYLQVPLIKILTQSVYINTIIGVFNLIPFPPLDGSRMLSSFLSYNAQRKYEELGRFGFVFFIILMFTGVTRYIFYPALFLAQQILEGFASVL